MDKSRPRAMDIKLPRQSAVRRSWKLSARQLIVAAIALVVIVGAGAGLYWYKHRNDQVILHDRYQVVYTLTGQVYFGKLQNTSGQYLTLTHVFTMQNQKDASGDTNTSNIVQVMRQVYGPDDSMAIRADQVQFWQNLRTDSKVAQAIQSAGQQNQ